MHISLCMMAEKSSLGMAGKNGEKPKIQITELVKIGNHSTVFSAVNQLWYVVCLFVKALGVFELQKCYDMIFEEAMMM